MAIMLPVGPGGLFGDSSLQGASDSPIADSVCAADGASDDAASTTNTPEAKSFWDALHGAQKGGSSKTAAKDHKTPAAPIGSIPVPFQLQQNPLPGGAKGKQPTGGGSSDDSDGGGAAAVGSQTSSNAANAIALAAALDGDSDAQADGQETPTELHSLTAPVQTLAQSDVALAASRASDKQDSDSPGSGASNLAPQMMWSAAQGVGSSPASAVADARVAGSGMAERIDVVRQISTQIQASAPAAATPQQTVTLNIHPDHWGALTINLTMESGSGAAGQAGSGGAITATIVAQSSAVRDALAGQSKELQSSLESAGIKLQKLDVITAAAATGTVASGHAASQSGLDTNARSGSFAQQSHQPHSGAGSQTASGGQDQRPGQQFASMFSDSGRDQVRAGWLPSLAAPVPASAGQEQAPIAASGLDTNLNILA